MAEIRLTSWYGKYPIIYRVSAPSQVVSQISAINSMSCEVVVSMRQKRWCFLEACGGIQILAA